MAKDAPPEDPLAAYVRATGKSDAAIGRLIDASRWKISRGRRGDPPFSMEDQIALERFTGVSPVEWANYYPKLLKARAKTEKKSLAASEAA